MTIRYISDCHFGHANIIAYDNRPFDSVGQMDEAMIQIWNDTVSKEDLTYVVGDFCWSQTYEVWVELLRRLNGQVFIVKGNHDRSSILRKLDRKGHIAGWSQQEIVKDGLNKVVLNHSPMPFYINMHQPNWVHLYGHVHISWDWNMMLSMQRQITALYQDMPRMYNVGCMVPYIYYIPRTLQQIEEGFADFDPLKMKYAERHFRKEPKNG